MTARTHRSGWPGASHHTHHRWSHGDFKMIAELRGDGGGYLVITDTGGGFWGGQVLLGFRDDAGLMEFCRVVEGLHRELLGTLYPDEGGPRGRRLPAPRPGSGEHRLGRRGRILVMRPTTPMPTWEYLEHLKDEIGELADHLPVAAEDAGNLRRPDFSVSLSDVTGFVTALREADDDEIADVVQRQLEEFASGLQYEVDQYLSDHTGHLLNFEAEFGGSLRELHRELVAECAQPYRNPSRGDPR